MNAWPHEKKTCVFFDKRSAQRHHDESPVTVRYFTKGSTFTARSCNYSKDGIYFELDLPLKPGADLYIRREKSHVTRKCHEGFRSVTIARIQWCKRMPGNRRERYGVGARYYEPF